MKTWGVGVLLVVLASAAVGQQSRLSFEVTSIRPAAPHPLVRIRMNTDAGMLRYIYVTLREVIRQAYRVKDFQIQGPDWLDSERFDIVAKFPAGATQDQVPEMLQSLLADRFKLVLHRQTKEYPIYALVVGKRGAKLKPPEIATRTAVAGHGAADSKDDLMRIMLEPSGMHLKTPAASLGSIADALSRFSERPIIDMSGVQGRYSFDFIFAPEMIRGLQRGAKLLPPGAEKSLEQGPSIFDAVQAYGLKLEARKAMIEVLTIDHIEKMPTEN